MCKISKIFVQCSLELAGKRERERERELRERVRYESSIHDIPYSFLKIYSPFDKSKNQSLDRANLQQTNSFQSQPLRGFTILPRSNDLILVKQSAKSIRDTFLKTIVSPFGKRKNQSPFQKTLPCNLQWASFFPNPRLRAYFLLFDLSISNNSPLHSTLSSIYIVINATMFNLFFILENIREKNSIECSIDKTVYIYIYICVTCETRYHATYNGRAFFSIPRDCA